MTSFKVNLKLGAASELIRDGAQDGLKLAVEHLLTEANKVVPLEEGTLTRSGNPTIDEATLTGAVSYDTPYAVKQHEDMTLRHENGRRAKYLETTMTAEGTTVARIIQAAIASKTGG